MSLKERDQHKDECLKESLIEGAKASAWALATSGLLVGLANQFLPAFRSSLGVSGKTALIVRLSKHDDPADDHETRCPRIGVTCRDSEPYPFA